MIFKNKLIKRFLLLAFVFHTPIILISLKIKVAFLPALIWFNIPVLWTGIAEAMGKEHFIISAFGASPQSMLAYSIIIGFWLLIAAFLAYLSAKKYRVA